SLVGCPTSVNYVSPYSSPVAFVPVVAYGTDDYANQLATPDCTIDGAGDWTTNLFGGLGFATGSSRHFSLANQSVGPNGAIDLPIPTVQAPANTIIITKVTNPAN